MRLLRPHVGHGSSVGWRSLRSSSSLAIGAVAVMSAHKTNAAASTRFRGNRRRAVPGFLQRSDSGLPA